MIGRYRILELIGEGGMGQVYLAEHTRLGRKVALKRLRADLMENPVLRRRFLAEARAASRIAHDHVVEITDFVESQAGDQCYVMELLRGESLAGLLAREGVLPLARALDIAVQVTGALGAVHRAGIVHRDLKPENIHVGRRGPRDFVKLLDFGIAKLADAAEGMAPGDALGGTIMGTLEYMSPEQASGDVVDGRTDIYAFGVILYELVTGRKAFDFESVEELLAKQRTVRPSPPSHVRPLPSAIVGPLDALILSCLESAPDRRPRDMPDVEARLRAIARALPSVEGARSVRPGRAHAAQAFAALAAGCALAAAVFGGYVSARAAGPRAKPTGLAATAPVQAEARAEDAAARVQVVFESAPPGAEVYRLGADRPVGVTPFTSWFERSPRTEQFEFRISGRVAGRAVIALDEDARILVITAAERAAEGVAAPPGLRPAPAPAPVPAPGPADPQR